jgi:hypothetical protein
MTEFVAGRCYYNLLENTESPRIMICRKFLLVGLYLVPQKALLKIPMHCDSAEVRAGKWFDCTEQVKRAEAMLGCYTCPLVNITQEHVGTTIAYLNEHGEISAPVFLYSYANGMAFIMSLDGKDKLSNLRLRQCFPLQAFYKDITERAVSDDPLKSSIFDSFLAWLKGTNQYNRVVTMMTDLSAPDRENMLKLFELMSFEGITADMFEQEVKARYKALSVSKREGLSLYAAVLDAYNTPVTAYSKVDKEIMRATGFQYKTPKEAWAIVGKGKPYPKFPYEVNVEPPRTAHQYICDKIGLYDGNVASFWYGKLCPKTEAYFDMETQYKEGIARYLEVVPEFDESQLGFIKEEDKKGVIGQFVPLDANDPFRSWTENPPGNIIRAAKQLPGLSYVEVLRKIYEESVE